MVTLLQTPLYWKAQKKNHQVSTSTPFALCFRKPDGSVLHYCIGFPIFCNHQKLRFVSKISVSVIVL